MRAVNQERACDQWQALAAALFRNGAEIKLLSPVYGLPDMVFTRNGALSIPSVDGEKQVILAAFKYEERRLERAHFFAWFQRHGYSIRYLPEHIVFEGNGEAIMFRNMLFTGYGSTRMTFQTVPFIAALLYGQKMGYIEVVPLRLVSEDFYHLDTCFMPILRSENHPDLIVYYPDAFDRYTISRINAIPDTIPIAVSKYDAYVFGCNFVVCNDAVIMPNGTVKLADTLRAHGVSVMEIEMSEFIECGGGGPFCLTLAI